MVRRDEPSLFSALLRDFRKTRGMTQLELSLAAGVSTRHLSFLETGRAAPSQDMVLALCTSIGLTEEERDKLLQASGFEAAEPREKAAAMSRSAKQIIEMMLRNHEPNPMFVVDGRFDVLWANRIAWRITELTVKNPARLERGRLNGFSMMIDPELCRDAIVDWERTFRVAIASARREAMLSKSPHKSELESVFKEVLGHEGVDPTWLEPPPWYDVDPYLTMEFRVGDEVLSFFVIMTGFCGPKPEALEDVRIQSYYAADDETAEFCRRIAADESAPGLRYLGR